MNTIIYEFLRRVHYIYPSFSFDNNPTILNFLPQDVPEILLFPSFYDLLPFPNPNPSTEGGRYGDPTIPLPSGKWLKAGKEGETWTEVLRASEVMMCPMAGCNEFDCELHCKSPRMLHFDASSCYLTLSFLTFLQRLSWNATRESNREREAVQLQPLLSSPMRPN